MYYLRMGDATVVGSSPEMLVKVAGRKVEYRPIAGTRRAGSRRKDKRLEQELRSDTKECAEHIMLVDLGRNDVGRVSEFSSVHPTEVMFVERYSHVMHLVSQITGRLRPDADTYARSPLLPRRHADRSAQGSRHGNHRRTGAYPRGLYGGAVLYLDFSGNLTSCIVIRTVLIKNKTAYLQAGAGIVADSVPPANTRNARIKPEPSSAPSNSLKRAVAVAFPSADVLSIGRWPFSWKATSQAESSFQAAHQLPHDLERFRIKCLQRGDRRARACYGHPAMLEHGGTPWHTSWALR